MAVERSPFIAAYLFDEGNGCVSPEDAKRLDRINYAFGLVKDGCVTGAHWKNIDNLHALKAANPHLKTILSLGGWGAGGFSDACATESGQERFAQTAVELMLKHHFDGIDLDWEYPTLDDAGIDARPEDKFTFTQMMRLLRGKLNALSLLTGQYYTLSMAVGCGLPRYARIMELEKLAVFLDEINLMTYDMRHGTSLQTGHHTNLLPNPEDPRPASAEYSVNLFLQAGVPIEKLVMGAAFYGRGWQGVENVNHGLHAPASGNELRGGLHYQNLCAAYINQNGFTRFWDEVAKAPYLFNGNTFISYDDPESVAHKMRYVKQMGMKGIMYWEYACDPSGELLSAMDAER